MVIPHNPAGPYDPAGKGLLPEARGASYQLVGKVTLTKAKTGSGCESMTRRIGTETLPGLLREAAVTNIPQCAKA